ncbi:MAG: hypothetical protein J7496_10630 [Novosphingobium sp.]|nr:hypothetical protein [Novosphingobium sp.]MBO9602949.1 hypothetical protein [Novosphingobium sp.]
MKTLQILQDNINHPVFKTTVAAAIEFVASRTIECDQGEETIHPSSKWFSDLYAFRKRIGYIKPGAAIGLDEMIQTLAANDVPVQMRTLELDRGAIAVWIDQQDELLGILVFPRDFPKDELK